MPETSARQPALPAWRPAPHGGVEDIEAPGKPDREYQELLDALYRAAPPHPYHFALPSPPRRLEYNSSPWGATIVC